MNSYTALLTATLFLTTLSTCDRAPIGEAETLVEGRESGRIDIREPREVAPVTRRPEFSAVDGQEAVLELAPVLMNLLAKYELAAERALVDGYEHDLLSRRAELRGAYNDFVQLGRRHNFSVPDGVPKELYRSTEELERQRGAAFFSSFERGVAADRTQLEALLRRFERRTVPGDFQRAFERLKATL